MLPLILICLCDHALAVFLLIFGLFGLVAKPGFWRFGAPAPGGPGAACARSPPIGNESPGLRLSMGDASSRIGSEATPTAPMAWRRRTDRGVQAAVGSSGTPSPSSCGPSRATTASASTNHTPQRTRSPARQVVGWSSRSGCRRVPWPSPPASRSPSLVKTFIAS